MSWRILKRCACLFVSAFVIATIIGCQGFAPAGQTEQASRAGRVWTAAVSVESITSFDPNKSLEAGEEILLVATHQGSASLIDGAQQNPYTIVEYAWDLEGDAQLRSTELDGAPPYGDESGFDYIWRRCTFTEVIGIGSAGQRRVQICLAIAGNSAYDFVDCDIVRNNPDYYRAAPECSEPGRLGVVTLNTNKCREENTSPIGNPLLCRAPANREAPYRTQVSLRQNTDPNLPQYQFAGLEYRVGASSADVAVGTAVPPGPAAPGQPNASPPAGETRVGQSGAQGGTAPVPVLPSSTAGDGPRLELSQVCRVDGSGRRDCDLRTNGYTLNDGAPAPQLTIGNIDRAAALEVDFRLVGSAGLSNMQWALGSGGAVGFNRQPTVDGTTATIRAGQITDDDVIGILSIRLRARRPDGTEIDLQRAMTFEQRAGTATATTPQAAAQAATALGFRVAAGGRNESLTPADANGTETNLVLETPNGTANLALTLTALIPNLDTVRGIRWFWDQTTSTTEFGPDNATVSQNGAQIVLPAGTFRNVAYNSSIQLRLQVSRSDGTADQTFRKGIYVSYTR